METRNSEGAVITSPRWFEVADVGALPSPALLVYRERVEKNVRRMVARAGGAELRCVLRRNAHE